MGKKIYFVNRTIFCLILFIYVISQLNFWVYAGTGSDVKKGLSKIEQIKKAGEIVVGTSANYPPYEFYLLKDKEGDLVGIDIDIAKVIAKELGVKLEIKDIIFSKIFTDLLSGSIDLGIAGLAPTEERKKKADFSDVYYQAIQSIVIRIEDVEKIKTIEDLRGKKVGTQKDTIQEEMARTQIGRAEFVTRDTIEELIIILKKGLIDALILEKPVADSYVLRNKDFMTIKCKGFDNLLGSAIAVKKGNDKLLKEINRILRELKKENKIEEFVENAKILTDKR